ncbi:MAG: DUF188 domain-containing protein [Actinomycetia bacterium]|nr:DUF188 domain-containing protein [Actinomycetes bacterium]
MSTFFIDADACPVGPRGRTGGPSKFTEEDREHFSERLEWLITTPDRF